MCIQRTGFWDRETVVPIQFNSIHKCSLHVRKAFMLRCLLFTYLTDKYCEFKILNAIEFTSEISNQFGK